MYAWLAYVQGQAIRFALKISTPTGSIFSQSLALKPDLTRTLATKFKSDALSPVLEGKINIIISYEYIQRIDWC